MIDYELSFAKGGVEVLETKTTATAGGDCQLTGMSKTVRKMSVSVSINPKKLVDTRQF